MRATDESIRGHNLAQVTARKFLTFSLSQELYGIAVLKVREIIKMTPVTAIPQMPPHVKGFINLRGKIIPIVDLRIKFEMEAAAVTEHTCIIVVQVASTARAIVSLGLIVDSIEEVLTLDPADIEETPDFGAGMDTANLLGMAKIKGRVATLLDIDRLVGADAQTAEAGHSTK